MAEQTFLHLHLQMSLEEIQEMNRIFIRKYVATKLKVFGKEQIVLECSPISSEPFSFSFHRTTTTFSYYGTFTTSDPMLQQTLKRIIQRYQGNTIIQNKETNVLTLYTYQNGKLQTIEKVTKTKREVVYQQKQETLSQLERLFADNTIEHTILQTQQEIDSLLDQRRIVKETLELHDIDAALREKSTQLHHLLR